MASRYPALVVLLPLLFVATASHAAVWYVPGTANVDGLNGTHFSSDLEILNRGDSSTVLSFDFVSLFGEAPPGTVSRTVLPGETLVVPNVIASLWGLEKTAGTIRVAADQPLLIAARTYNDAGGDGTFGTGLEAVPDASLLGPDDIGQAPWVSDSPDPSTGYRSNVGVFLSLPDSSVDVVLLDASGNEVGRQTVSGGPLAFQTSVRSIVPGGLPVGRAEFRVRAGKATGYVAVVDNVTGDGIAVYASRGAGAPLAAAVDGVAHSPGREGTYFQTDVRLFNGSAAPATVQVTPLALGQAPPVSVTLAPHEVKEIGDVLGTLFGLPDGSAGALRFFSSSDVTVLARTSNVHRDGTPGTFGAFQKAVPISSFLGVGSTASLIGLKQTSLQPGYRTNIGFLSGPSASSARLVLRDSTGALLATNELDVSLPPDGWMQPSLQDLFPGLTIPDDATLEVVPTSGTLDSFASVIDNVTGDPVVTTAARFVPYHCGPPQIYSFFAEPLPGPGTATLRWYSDADSVSLSPGNTASLAASGTLPVTLSATTEYTLVATNACGTSSRTVSAVVGTPFAPVLASASATPGQLLRVTPANVADPGDVTGVWFSFPDGVTLPADTVLTDGSGSFLVVVPFQPEVEAPGGYRQGTCTVSVVLHGNQPSPGASFTIAPLALPADPSGRFRDWVDRIAAAARSGISPITSLGGGAAARDVMYAEIDAVVATLHKAADDIAATGTAVLPVFEPTPADPTPAQTTVSRDQLAVYVAALDALSASELSVVASRRSLASIPCLKDDPGIKFCVNAAAAGELFDPLKLFNNFSNLAVGLQNYRNCATDVLQVAVYSMANRIALLLQLPTMICPLLNVYLGDPRDAPFAASPNRITQDVVSKASLHATLVRLSDQGNLAAQIAQEVGTLLATRYGASYQCASAIGNLIGSIVQHTQDLYKPLIDAALANLSIAGLTTPSRTVQVSRCDVIVTSANTSLLDLTSQGCAVQGDPDYCLLGYSPGGSTVLKVIVNPTSFMFKDQRFLGYGDRPPYDVPITIGPGQPSLVSGIFSGGPGYPAQTLTPGQKVEISGDEGGAYYELKVSQDAPKAWRMSWKVAGGPSLGPSTYITSTLSMPGFSGGRFEGFVNASGSLTAPSSASYSYEFNGQLRSVPETATFGQPGPVSNGSTTLDLSGTHLLINNPSSGELKGYLGAFVGTNPNKDPGSFSFEASVEVTYRSVGQ